MPGRTYLTTTLPYVNADPHIGFALELVQADIIARYKRLTNEEVFFNFGTDEHGQKIWQKAESEGREVQEYVNYYAERFRELKSILNISYDAFIRTTDPHHIEAAQELWRKCEKDIYKKQFKGLYCVGCEAFVKASDLVDGKCPIHKVEPEEVEEENYFFKLSNYQDRLLEYVKSENVIFPETKRQEALIFINKGLEDFSISRLKAKMPWGIDVPGDKDHVMYVWFDALTNYISTLGWPNGDNFQKFWQEGKTIQFAGKDQMRFQSLMWQAMLMSADIKNTDTVVYHGHITSGGQKMSKSFGNVINPLELVNEYGADAVRYFLARHVNPFEDSDFTIERFKEAYNSGLANGLGNFVSRVMAMSQKGEPGLSLSDQTTRLENLRKHLDLFNFNLAMEHIWQTISDGDAKIQEAKPFELVKTDPEKAKEVIADLVWRVHAIGVMLEPFMPETSKIILEAVRENKKPDNLFPRKD